MSPDLLDRHTLAVLHHGDAREEEIDPPRVVWDEDLGVPVEVPRARKVIVVRPNQEFGEVARG